MDRRSFVAGLGSALLLGGSLTGCRGRQVAHVLEPNSKDMVGSHTAGAETWKPLIDDSVAKLLGRQIDSIQQVSHKGEHAQLPLRKRVCFLGVENKSAEEIGDFKEQVFEQIDQQISCSEMFELISRRFVEAGLREARLGPADLFVPTNQRTFAAIMEEMQQPFDYLLYAKITSGTTVSNKSYQRDYMLTLEMVNIHSGTYDKESATLSKGYHKSRLGKWANY